MSLWDIDLCMQLATTVHAVLTIMIKSFLDVVVLRCSFEAFILIDAIIYIVQYPVRQKKRNA